MEPHDVETGVAPTLDRNRVGRGAVERMRLPGPPLNRPLPSKIGSLASGVERFASSLSRPVEIRRALAGPGSEASAVRPPRWWTGSAAEETNGVGTAQPVAPAWHGAAREVSPAELPARQLPRASRSVPQQETYTPGGIIGGLRAEVIRVRRPDEVAAAGPMVTSNDRSKVNALTAVRRRTAAAAELAAPAALPAPVSPALPATRGSSPAGGVAPASPGGSGPGQASSTPTGTAPRLPSAGIPRSSKTSGSSAPSASAEKSAAEPEPDRSPSPEADSTALSSSAPSQAPAPVRRRAEFQLAPVASRLLGGLSRSHRPIAASASSAPLASAGDQLPKMVEPPAAVTPAASGAVASSVPAPAMGIRRQAWASTSSVVRRRTAGVESEALAAHADHSSSPAVSRPAASMTSIPQRLNRAATGLKPGLGAAMPDLLATVRRAPRATRSADEIAPAPVAGAVLNPAAMAASSSAAEVALGAGRGRPANALSTQTGSAVGPPVPSIARSVADAVPSGALASGVSAPTASAASDPVGAAPAGPPVPRSITLADLVPGAVGALSSGFATPEPIRASTGNLVGGLGSSGLPMLRTPAGAGALGAVVAQSGPSASAPVRRSALSSNGASVASQAITRSAGAAPVGFSGLMSFAKTAPRAAQTSRAAASVTRQAQSGWTPANQTPASTPAPTATTPADSATAATALRRSVSGEAAALDMMAGSGSPAPEAVSPQTPAAALGTAPSGVTSPVAPPAGLAAASPTSPASSPNPGLGSAQSAAPAAPAATSLHGAAALRRSSGATQARAALQAFDSVRQPISAVAASGGLSAMHPLLRSTGGAAPSAPGMAPVTPGVSANAAGPRPGPGRNGGTNAFSADGPTAMGMPEAALRRSVAPPVPAVGRRPAPSSAPDRTATSPAASNSGSGSLLDRTAGLFAAGSAAGSASANPGDPTVRRLANGATHYTAASRSNTPAAVQAQLEPVAANLSEADKEALIREVVERVERRVIDDLERRGRRDGRSGF